MVVQAPPLYIQEKVHPKVLIDDLVRQTTQQKETDQPRQLNLFDDFNGLPSESARTEFYQHDANWSNRMILGDSLQVMASLAEREGLRGKVQCIYIDPPYGIKFNSNFQWSTTSRDVKDGKADHITREPEQVKAFRDTWRDGIHSYLTYLRDRLTVTRDLLTDSGSVFVQIGDENVHRVRALLDEVFGADNFISLITFAKTTGQTDNLLAQVSDYLLWYGKKKEQTKYRQLLLEKEPGGVGSGAYRKIRWPDGTSRAATKEELNGIETLPKEGKLYRADTLTSQSPGTRYPVKVEGRIFNPKGYWKTQESSMPRLLKAQRVLPSAMSLSYLRYIDDFAAYPMSSSWPDTTLSGSEGKVYVVQTGQKILQRCILMATDPGDLVLDPTCGSGTTAYVAEQ